MDEISDTDVFVNVRLPRPLVDKLDEIKNERGTNRTIEVTRAINFLVNAQTCPECGTLNDIDAVVCSCCEKKLDNFREMVGELREVFDKFSALLEEIRKMRGEYEEMYDKISWLINKQKPELVTRIKSLLSPLDNYCLRAFEKVNDLLMRIDEAYAERNSGSGVFKYHNLKRTMLMEDEYVRTLWMLESLKDELDSTLPLRTYITYDDVKVQIKCMHLFARRLSEIRENFSMVLNILYTIEHEVDLFLQESK